MEKEVSYNLWKDWRNENFGNYSIQDSYYYDKILSFSNCENISNVLEIGFGNGSFLGFMRTKNIDIYGVEVIEELIDAGKINGFNVGGSIDEIENNIKFDAIFMFDVLEHIPQDDIVTFLKKCLNRLNDDGVMIIRTPNGSSPLGLANQYGDVTHCTVVTSPKMHYWMKSLGSIVVYTGRDVYPLYDGRFFKMTSRMIRYTIQIVIEKLVRIIFAPQSSGILSANLLTICKK